MTPSLPAAQPASTHRRPEIRPLGKENDKAFALINALDAAQRVRRSWLQGRGPRARAGQDGEDHPAGRHPGVGDDAGAAGDAARPRARVGRHRHRRVWRAADGRDQGDIAADLVRVERPDDERQRGVFPDSGADAGDRVRAAAQHRSHPHHLPRSDQRLRCEVRGEVSAHAQGWRSVWAVLSSTKVLLHVAWVLVLVAVAGPVSAHRLDEYLQAARIGIDPERVQIELDLTPGVRWRRASSRRSIGITTGRSAGRRPAPTRRG